MVFENLQRLSADSAAHLSMHQYALAIHDSLSRLGACQAVDHHLQDRHSAKTYDMHTTN